MCAYFQHLKHVDVEIAFILLAFVIGMCNLFVYCYFGMLANESFQNMAECLYESKWHELTLDMKKATLLMIQNMHKPIYYHGFGVAVLNHETFIKVNRIEIFFHGNNLLIICFLLFRFQFLRGVFTYYMAFKTLNE